MKRQNKIMSEPLPAPAASNTFERIKHVTAAGADFWSARELARVLDYSEFRHFLPVIAKAREACLNSAHRVADHFEQILEMVTIGSGAQRPVEDWKLSRYACYLVIQNADPSKPLVALGQSYFAVQTRRQELANAEPLQENQKRLLLRAEMKTRNKKLAGVAKQSGVVQPLDYAIFMDHGYRGLYGGFPHQLRHQMPPRPRPGGNRMKTPRPIRPAARGGGSQRRRRDIFVAHQAIRVLAPSGAAYFAPDGAGGLWFAAGYHDVAPTALAQPAFDDNE